MKKEVIIAIIIGISIGLVITFGIKTAQKSLNNELQNPQPETTTASLENPENPTHTLSITSPKPNAIIDSDTITVAGSTSPFSLLSAISTTDQNTSMADSQGNFSVNVSVSPGVNTVYLTSTLLTGENASEQLAVVQTDSDFDELNEPTKATASPTPKGNRT